MMDNLVNQAAKWRLMLGGDAQSDASGRGVCMPIVIRGPQGGGHRLSAQHSQSLESWFTAVPGLKVVMPSSPSDAKGLLLAAVRDPNPVVFLEHKNLYQLPKSAVPAGDYEIPLGVADVKRSGSDVTVAPSCGNAPHPRYPRLLARSCHLRAHAADVCASFHVCVFAGGCDLEHGARRSEGGSAAREAAGGQRELRGYPPTPVHVASVGVVGARSRAC